MYPIVSPDIYKRALYILKRALYILKRALRILKRDLCIPLSVLISTKEQAGGEGDI